MSRIVAIDSGPLGLLCYPGATGRALRCQTWARELLSAGVVVLIPEIADYEVRRELIREDRASSLARLDRLKIGFDYTPITTEAMHRAAELWAFVRSAGMPTAAPEALDGDCILAAQVLTAAQPGDEVLIATTNAGHLGRFPGVDARPWESIDRDA